MARNSGQKLKLLYLMRIFNEQTDQEHPLTAAQLIAQLEMCGVSAERKSLYNDIETLRTFGMDIVTLRGKTTGYYLGMRDFEVAQLKILVDSVLSSKFITAKKTAELIAKLQALAGRQGGQLLGRQVYVAGRIKSMNETIYYNVDLIHTAILNDRRITFRYFEYGPDKQRRYRRNGAQYEVSPFALTWDDENYYLVAYDGQAGHIKHFRVDKMTGIAQQQETREGGDEYGRLDMATYAKKTFSMFTGRETPVFLEFDNSAAGAVIDRFGKDVDILPGRDGEHFRIHPDVAISPPFFGWLISFGQKVRLIGPPEVLGQFTALLDGVRAVYTSESKEEKTDNE